MCGQEVMMNRSRLQAVSAVDLQILRSGVRSIRSYVKCWTVDGVHVSVCNWGFRQLQAHYPTFGVKSS